MSAVSMAAFAVVTAVLALTVRSKNGEIALLLTVACAAGMLLGVMQGASAVIAAVQSVVSAAGLNSSYLTVLLKVIGICLLTEFAANTCRDSGSAALASNVTLAGKLMATVTALPLYVDIFNTVLSIMNSR